MLILVWFSLLRPPSRALRELDRMIVEVAGVIIIEIIARGEIFCQVDKIMHTGQELNCIVVGNQKCIGAAPIFMRMARGRRS